jgi:hypothetical protein
MALEGVGQGHVEVITVGEAAAAIASSGSLPFHLCGQTARLTGLRAQPAAPALALRVLALVGQQGQADEVLVQGVALTGPLVDAATATFGQGLLGQLGSVCSFAYPVILMLGVFALPVGHCGRGKFGEMVG